MPGDETRFIAFLKGINVGGHTVKMELLRRLFDQMGHGSVETYIASGNVIFESPEADRRVLEESIASHLESQLGYSVPAFVRSAVELAQVAAKSPFTEADRAGDGASLYLVFLAEPLGPEATVRLQQAATDTDRFHADGRELYWLCRTRFSDSPFSGPVLEKLVGAQVTVRNSNTIRKIAIRYCGLAA